MKDDRSAIFARIRSALSALPTRAPMPEFADDAATARAAGGGAGRASLVATFVERLTRAGGRAFDDAEALAAWLDERGIRSGYCDPRIAEELGPALRPKLELQTRFDVARVDEYGFGITRAVAGIAETGSVVLGDASTSRRLATVAPWVHVAVLRRADVHRTVAQAIGALGDDPYVVWCTGPSKTADVEGILISGVHGPGEQAVLLR